MKTKNWDVSFYCVNLCRNHFSWNEYARTHLEIHSRNADSRLFHHCRNTTHGEGDARRTGCFHSSEAETDRGRDRGTKIRVPGRGVAHHSDLLPDRPGGGRTLWWDGRRIFPV